MSRDKQIEEMMRIINRANGEPDDSKYSEQDATDLYNAGYRKASEVAEDIIRMLRAAGINEFRYPIVADIKKKYESEDIK